MNKIHLLLAAAALGAGPQLPAQVMPNAPVINFRLPMFNAGGFKTWEVRGSEGRYVDENRVEITALNLKVFAGDEAGTLETEITSPLAIVFVKDRIISGPGALRVVGRGYEMFGEDWIYEDSKKSVVIRRDVIVTFDATVGSILK